MSNPHSAFPALPPPDLPSSSIPNNPTDLFSFITTPAPASYHVKVLLEIARGTNQPGTKSSVQMKRGEELLSLPEWDLKDVDDESLQKNTAVLIFVVSARLSSEAAKKYGTKLYDLAARLCTMGDSQQISLCLNRVHGLAWGIVTLGRRYKKGGEMIPPLQALVQRAAPSVVFTAAYPALLEACLQHREFELGYGFTQNIFTDVRSSSPTYNDVLAYYHHAGTIAAAIGEYERARELFSFAVTMPTQTATAGQIACAKRAILCELVVSGKVLIFAKYTSNTVTRGIERHAADYTKLAKAYQNKSWAEIRATKADPFQKDNNYGLFLRVIDSITKRRILHVRDVYSILDLDELSWKVGLQRSTGLKQTEDVLKEMIATGMIRATISPASDPKRTIIAFAEPDEAVNPATAFSQLERYNELTQWLQAELAASGQRYGSSEQYLQKQSDMLAASGKGKGGIGRQMDDYEAMIMNEGGGAGSAGGSMGNKVGTVAGDQNDMGY